uniref:BEN domain-containing protein n=1 Tax=Daphnia galeata TaxID=27404 RepID=A0A8J2RKW9_9CRUS|nr:unnamed protein product [Daphnia galeata]
MGILDGFPPYALYLFEDSYEVGSTSLIDWNGSEAEEFDFSHEHVVFWPERPADSNKGKKLKSKSYPAKVLCFNESKLTLRGIAKDIASGEITIEEVVKNNQVPAEPPCSVDFDGAASRKSKREKKPSFKKKEYVEVMAAPAPSKPAKSSAAKKRTMKSQFNSQTFKMLSDNSAANGDAAESDDSIQQSLSSNSSYKKRNDYDFFLDSDKESQHRKETRKQMEYEAMKDKLRFYESFLDLRTQIFDICEMKKRVVKLYSVGKSSVSSQHSSTSSSSSSSSNDEANKNDDAVSYSLAYPATSSPSDESTSHTSKVGKSGTKFPISMKVVEKLSKDAKINLFITRLLDYLYTEEFMASTTVTNKRNKSASPSEKGQLDEKELREIIDVTNKRFPPSDVDAQEKLIRTTVGVKFNNVAAKLKKQLLKPSERILSDAIE